MTPHGPAVGPGARDRTPAPATAPAPASSAPAPASSASAAGPAPSDASPAARPAPSIPGIVTARARQLVSERRATAVELGRRLADNLDDPEGFVRLTEAGLQGLADPKFRAGLRFVAPTVGPVLGVRGPLLGAVERGLRRELRGVRPSRLLPLADALARAEIRELRWLSISLLGRVVRDEPELAWQVLRRIGRDADDWITTDTLAGVLAPAILREPYRWAELEQLVYSPQPWERRLVGATVASVALASHATLRDSETVQRCLDLVALLLGDDEPVVQKALGWALRNLARVDQGAVATFCGREAETASRTGDGNRAWVLRDAATRLGAGDAASIRATLAGIRRIPGTPATSPAAATAAAFVAARQDGLLPEMRAE